jgi:hypothetical protein
MSMIRKVAPVVIVIAAACGGSPHPAQPPPPPPASHPTTRAERVELKAKGLAAYEHGDWAGCATLLAQAEDPYDAACCYARAGDADHAFALLPQAFDHGFRDADHLRADPDLAALHADPRWATVVADLDAKIAAYKASVNAELFQIYTDDQADRQGTYESIDWSVVTPRDIARRTRVDEIIAAGGATVGADYLHAAMVYQHGESTDDYRRANELARKAVELDPDDELARWLVAATEDRWLVKQGKPQKWATQYGKKHGVWVLEDVDPSITDAERAEWDCPPLAEARARADQMNADAAKTEAAKTDAAKH